MRHLACLVVLLSLAFADRALAQSLAGKEPNIVFILTDDQGYGDLSAHGNPIVKTPNMDRLHREGVRFTDFHVSPTCAPTRSALLTGRHEFKNGITHTILERERLTPEAITLPQVLKTAGYTSGIFGKWHLGDEPEYRPNRRGFDEVFIHGAGGIGQSYPGSCGDFPGNKYFDPVILHNGKPVKTQGYCTDVFFDQAIRWMDTVKGKEPFYCHIATNAPHTPLDARPEDEARYAGKVTPNQAKYFGMVANIDDNIGKLLEQLAKWGIEKDTLVVFITDNGGTGGVPIFNAGMRGQKGSPWLGGTRAVSIWRWPGTLTPGDCGALTAHIDFLPTLSELAGAKLDDKVQAQVEGRSLVPLLMDPKANWAERTLITHVGRWPKGANPDNFQYANCSVRTPRWHMVNLMKGKGKGIQKQWMLFDVQKDYGEQMNVAREHPEVVAKLEKEFDGWWVSLKPLLVNEDAPGPKTNPFHDLYWEVFEGNGPNNVPRPQK